MLPNDQLTGSNRQIVCSKNRTNVLLLGYEFDSKSASIRLKCLIPRACGSKVALARLNTTFSDYFERDSASPSDNWCHCDEYLTVSAVNWSGVSVNWSGHSVNWSQKGTNCICWIVNLTLSSDSKRSQLTVVSSLAEHVSCGPYDASSFEFCA